MIRFREPDSLAGDDWESKARSAVRELKSERDFTLKRARAEAAAAEVRFSDVYQRLDARGGVDSPHSFNTLGEIQGNHLLVDVLIVQYQLLDDIVRHFESLDEESPWC